MLHLPQILQGSQNSVGGITGIEEGYHANLGVRLAVIGLAVFALWAGDLPVSPGPAEAHSSRNWSQAERSRYCSAQAQRYADRRTRRTTAAGALTGAAVGSMANNNRSRNAGRGALIGGSAGLVRSNSRWTSYYNRYYRNCIRW